MKKNKTDISMQSLRNMLPSFFFTKMPTFFYNGSATWNHYRTSSAQSFLIAFRFRKTKGGYSGKPNFQRAPNPIKMRNLNNTSWIIDVFIFHLLCWISFIARIKYTWFDQKYRKPKENLVRTLINIKRLCWRNNPKCGIGVSNKSFLRVSWAKTKQHHPLRPPLNSSWSLPNGSRYIYLYQNIHN